MYSGCNRQQTNGACKLFKAHNGKVMLCWNLLKLSMGSNSFDVLRDCTQMMMEEGDGSEEVEVWGFLLLKGGF